MYDRWDAFLDNLDDKLVDSGLEEISLVVLVVLFFALIWGVAFLLTHLG